MLEELNYLIEPLYETLFLTFVPLVLAVILGALIGTIIFISGDNGILDVEEKPFLKTVHVVFDALVNIFRSVPYLILLIWLLPITRFLVGSTIGTNAAVPSLTLSATPFFARMVVIAFTEVDKGTIEASKALGAGTLDIIFKVLIPESLPALISSIAVTAINLVSYSTMAGAIGAGGLGFEAYQYGLIRQDPPRMLMATGIIIVIVFIIQIVGDVLSKYVDKR